MSREVPLTRLGLEEAATGVTVPEPAAAMLAMPLAVAGEPTGSVELEAVSYTHLRAHETLR